MNWQDTLIDLIQLELEQCPKEQNCFINNITRFMEKTIEKKLAERDKEWKKKLDNLVRLSNNIYHT